MSERYRALLAAYPARLRRRHGAELIATLVEMAGPGGRPARADRLRLVLDGFRERFRLPVRRRPIVLAVAVLATLIGGALGVGAASWAGMWTYPATPDPSSLAQRLLNPATPASTPWQERSYFTMTQDQGPGTDPAQTARDLRQRFAADGWAVTGIGHAGGTAGRYLRYQFEAESGGVTVEVLAYADADRLVDVTAYGRRPAVVLPMLLGGLLLGMVTGWLTAVAATHRITAARRRRASTLIAALGGALLAWPTLLLYLSVADFFRHDNGRGVGTLPHRFMRASEGDLPGVPLLLGGLLAIAIAVLIARPVREDAEAAQVA